MSLTTKHLLKVKEALAKTPSLINPHITVPDITHINFEQIKSMGYEKLIFEKENILTHVRTYE